MSPPPIPDFHIINKYQSLSTKKERKLVFSPFDPPPKAPVRSSSIPRRICPVPRIYSLFKEEAPRPVSFREDSDQTFISESPFYGARSKGTYFDQCYILECVLGRGSFGEVFKVISKESGITYACKRTLLKYKGELDRFRRIEEVRKHEQLPPHVNCVRFFRAWEEDHHLYLLTEVCKCSLAHLSLNNHEFCESQLWSFLVDILQGLHHLHHHKLIHMDVKPDNIFIGTDGVCKLGDFGLVIDFTNGYPSEAVEGDPRYLAPECLQNVYTPAADVFSLGMVMLELATDLYLPHSGPHWHQLRSGAFPSLNDKGFSPDFDLILKSFLNPDWKMRLSASEAVQLDCICKVARRKNVIQFFKTKISAFKYYLQSLLVWPLVFLSFVASTFNLRPLQSPLTWDAGLGLDPPSTGPLEDTASPSMDPPWPRPYDTSAATMSESIVNSTPISSLKRRQLLPRPNLSRCLNDDDSVDGSSKFSLNESSFSTLDSSHDDLTKRQNLSPLPSVSRNLVNMFDAVESSDDDA